MLLVARVLFCIMYALNNVTATCNLKQMQICMQQLWAMWYRFNVGALRRFEGKPKLAKIAYMGVSHLL